MSDPPLACQLRFKCGFSLLIFPGVCGVCMSVVSGVSEPRKPCTDPQVCHSQQPHGTPFPPLSSSGALVRHSVTSWGWWWCPIEGLSHFRTGMETGCGGQSPQAAGNRPSRREDGRPAWGVLGNCPVSSRTHLWRRGSGVGPWGSVLVVTIPRVWSPQVQEVPGLLSGS